MILSPPRGLSVTTSGNPAAAQPPGFLAICRFGGRGAVSTAADAHTVILPTRVNSVTLISQNRFGTMAQYCIHDAGLRPNLAAFLYIELPPISNYVTVPIVFDLSGLYYVIPHSMMWVSAEREEAAKSPPNLCPNPVKQNPGLATDSRTFLMLFKNAFLLQIKCR